MGYRCKQNGLQEGMATRSANKCYKCDHMQEYDYRLSLQLHFDHNKKWCIVMTKVAATIRGLWIGPFLGHNYKGDYG